MQRVLGIDLGTTNSVVAYVYRGEPRIVPNRQNEESTSSVVGRGRRGELLVGTAAKNRAAVDPGNTIRSIKRFMGRRFASPEVQVVLERVHYQVTAGEDGDVNVWFGGRAYTPTEISSIILGRLKEEAEDKIGERLTRAVITVPAYFGERQVAATREAGRMAGFHVLRIVNEPTAAALAYGFIRETPDEDQTILVFDLGGGTFDISVLMLVGGVFTVLCVEGDNLLGGDDFDRLLTDRVLAAATAEHGVDLATDPESLYPVMSAAENVKINLSAELAAEIILPSIGTPPVTLLHEVTRDEFNELIRPKIDAAMKLVEKAIAGADVTMADVDQVLLVGGSTAIPYVEERLAALFGREKKIRKNIHPMKSVALGAAIQGQLVPEVECVHCHAHTKVAEDVCSGCDRSLTPPVKVACPTCFLYSDVGVSQCGKCGDDLSGGGADASTGSSVGQSGAVSPATASATCPTCGNVLPPGSSAFARCTDCSDVGGLKCLHCAAINAAGSTKCTECGTENAVVEITAQDLGIELNDGRMAVILPKNTGFPTAEPSPFSREFATAVADQRRLEIVVYQGADEVAQRNELCGYITLALPPGLSRSSPINVSFGLDDDHTITVSVKVRALGEEPRRVELQHSGRLDSESQQRLEAHRLTVTRFVDKWTHELTPAESAVFFQLIEEVDTMIGGSGGTRAGVDELTSRTERMVAMVSDVRGEDAFLTAVQVSAGKYLRQSDRDELAGFSREIDEARDRADWGAAAVVAGQGSAFVDGFGPDVRILTYCRTFANQGKLSPALTHRVLGALRAFDDAFDSGNEDETARTRTVLMELWDEVGAEIKAGKDDVTAVTKPVASG